MRLIDADAIPWTDLNDNPNSKIRVLVTFAEKVNKMPTIEERKRGRWVKTGQSFVFPNKFKGYSCSCCGFYLDKENPLFLFCPNCGTRMVQEGEDNGKVD